MYTANRNLFEPPLSPRQQGGLQRFDRLDLNPATRPVPRPVPRPVARPVPRPVARLPVNHTQPRLAQPLPLTPVAAGPLPQAVIAPPLVPIQTSVKPPTIPRNIQNKPSSVQRSTAQQVIAANQSLKETETKLNKQLAWPALILAIIGIISLIIVGFIPSMTLRNRIISLSLMLIWTIFWIIILYLLWYFGYRLLSGILLLISLLSLVLYIILLMLYAKP